MEKYLKILESMLSNWIPRDSVLFKLISLYKLENSETKKKINIIVGVFLLILLLILAKILGFGDIWFALFGKAAFITYIVYILILFIIFKLLCSSKARSGLGTTDDLSGRTSMDGGTYGSSKYMDEDRAREVFDIQPIERTTGVIYGQLSNTKSGSSVVSVKESEDGSAICSNTLVFGTPGDGKSVTKVIPDCIQCCKQGASFAVADPKGDIRKLVIDLVRKPTEEGGFGYKTYTFNTKNPNYSDGWNMLSEVIDRETGRLNSTTLNSWVKVYFDNTSGGGKEDSYFRQGAEELMKIYISVLTWRREKFIQELYLFLYQKITGSTTLQDDINEISLVLFEKMIINETKKRNYDLELVEARIDQIKVSAPKVNIDILCSLQSKSESIMHEVSTLPADHPGKIAYTNLQELKLKKADVWTSATSGLQNRLSLFTDRHLRLMLSTDDINLHDITKDKTALFIVTKDGDNTYKPILSLFYTFLISDAKDEFDREAEDDECVNTRRPLRVIIDEMYSNGKIGGDTGSDEAWLTTILSTTRSRLINMTMIFQSYSQMVEVYGDLPANSIMNCCSAIMFLGGNDQMSTEFLSKYTGETTAQSESYTETSSMFGQKRSEDTHIGYAKSYLLTSDEIRRTPKRKMILIPAKENPIRLSTFYYKDDPVSKNMKSVNIRKDIVSINERVRRNEIPRSAFYFDYSKTDEIAKIQNVIETEINRDSYKPSLFEMNYTDTEDEFVELIDFDSEDPYLSNEKKISGNTQYEQTKIEWGDKNEAQEKEKNKKNKTRKKKSKISVLDD